MAARDAGNGAREGSARERLDVLLPGGRARRHVRERPRSGDAPPLLRLPPRRRAASFGGAPSSVPLREGSARARRGSRFVLETSERAYVTSSLLSELPEGHPELLAALSLVVRNNRLARPARRPSSLRHDALQPLRTGRERLERRRGCASRQAVARGRRTSRSPRPKAAASGFPSLSAGKGEWTQVRTGAAVVEALGLEREPASLVRAPDGSYEIAALRLAVRSPEEPAPSAVVPGRGRRDGRGLCISREGRGPRRRPRPDGRVGRRCGGADFQALLARAWPQLRVVPLPPPGR